MVRLISGAARPWNGNGPDDASVAGRVFVEIDDREKVRRQPRLVAGPDVKRLWWSPFVVISISPLILCHRHRRECRDGQDQRPQYPCSTQPVGCVHIVPSASRATINGRH